MSPEMNNKTGQTGPQTQSQPSDIGVNKQVASDAASNPLRQSGQNIVGGMGANASGPSLVQNVDAYGNIMATPGAAYGQDPALQLASGTQNYMDLISQISEERISGYPQPQLYD